MKFGKGMSRYVVCVGPWAIKFARVRILHWIVRILRKVLVADLAFYREQVTRPEKSVARIQHLFSGVVANLEEYRFNRRHPELPLAKTLLTLFGLVNIQRRGVPVTEAELVDCPFREIAHLEDDLSKTEHYGRVDDQIVLLDYGEVRVNSVILNYVRNRYEELADSIVAA